MKSRVHMSAEFEVQRLQKQCAVYREQIARLETENKCLREQIERRQERDA